jgi:hypothetical protein
MHRTLTFCIISVLLTACMPTGLFVPTPTIPVIPSSTFTPIPTLTPIPSPTSTPSEPPGTNVLDFVSLLCNAQWMNGGHNLTACPGANEDHSGGFASPVDPTAEGLGLPPGTPVLLAIPSWNGFNSLFLRYPSFIVGPSDRFRTTLDCRMTVPCDVQFALEYYDAPGRYHSFLAWDYKSGDAPIKVDADLSSLAGQTVDFVLTLRLFHEIDSPQQDNGLWIAPHIYRPLS